MSIRVTRNGLAASVQDLGRTGFQHLGINPGGVMDYFSASAANFLLGNDAAAPVIEMHFPAPSFLFRKDNLIAISGADFRPTINGKPVRNNRVILIKAGSLLEFTESGNSSRAYLAFKKTMKISPWLNSFSTNTKAVCGGLNGLHLSKDDQIEFSFNIPFEKITTQPEVKELAWQADMNWGDVDESIYIIPGREWNLVPKTSLDVLLHSSFVVTSNADRMGYQLSGNPISMLQQISLVSTAVNFGTIQLLPDGQLIILMADHQTTGGYPRLAHVISAHLPKLAVDPIPVD